MDSLDEIIECARKIREHYHRLELTHHGSEWSVEEDALAYLTDAGLVGRRIMTEQNRWGRADAASHSELKYKLGENVWWLIVLADRSGIDIKDAIATFLSSTKQSMGI